MNSGYPNPEGYVHVRTIISIVLGLSITRLFTGLARFDTGLKGTEYFRSLGLQYLFRNFAYVAVSVTAMFVENRRFHAVFVACALVYLVVWMAQRYLIFS